jgi:hypothetical protein
MQPTASTLIGCPTMTSAMEEEGFQQGVDCFSSLLQVMIQVLPVGKVDRDVPR